MLARGQGDGRLRDRLPRLPPASAGDGDRAGEVLPVDLQVELPARAVGGDAEVEVVVAGRGDVDRVRQPFARARPPEVVPAAGVDGGLQIDAGGPIRAAEIGGVDVVVGDALAAVVEVLRLDRR